ncbi:unnamed protein product, partial [Rotaria sp. Silwood2]
MQLHANFYLNDVCDNIDTLLNRLFADEQEHTVHLNCSQCQKLTQALKRICIPLTCPNLRLQSSINYASEQLSNQNLSTSFIPSKPLRKQLRKTVHDVHVDQIIRDHRWIVLLGSSGCGKTTLARWLTYEFTRAISRDLEQVSIKDGDEKKHFGPARLPILICVSEFTDWLQSHPTSTLFDYLGQHTWQNESYLKEKFEMIQDFVLHRYALIILDGLDAVATFELRAQALKLIQDFIGSFVLSSDFISVYDDVQLAKMWSTQVDRCEGIEPGNVIIITGRIAGYDVQPLRSELIAHHRIIPMTPKDVSDFVTTWCTDVQAKVINLFITIVPKLKDRQLAENQDWLCASKLLEIFHSRKEITAWASNRRLLSILCILFARHGIPSLANTRMLLYQQMVELIIQQSQTENHILKYVLSQLALYIHLCSKSGLIDEFDLKTLCRLSFKQWHNQNSNEHCPLSLSELRYKTEQFIQILNEDTGMVATPYLGIYGFFHSSFQEYFVHISMMTKNPSPEELAPRFYNFYSRLPMRGPLLFAMSKISSEWDWERYNRFCDQLISYNNHYNKYVPLGALLFVTSLADLTCLPSKSIVFNALDSLLLVDDDEPETCFFQSSLSVAFNILPVLMVHQWFEHVLSSNVASRLKLILIAWTVISTCEIFPRWINLHFLRIFCSYSGDFEEKFDVYIQKIWTTMSMTITYQRSKHMFQNLRSYLLAKPDVFANLDTRVLAAIIALYGGLERTESKKDEKRHITVRFSPQRIFKNSPLSSVFIDYLNDAGDQTSRMQRLIDQCHQIVSGASSSDVSLRVIHSFVVLLCVNGISPPSSYHQYPSQNALQRAVHHLKLIRIYLHDYYIHMRSADTIELTTLVQKKGDTENLMVFQSLAHAYGSLVCVEDCPHDIRRSHKINKTKLVNLKLPMSFEQQRFLEYTEEIRLIILSFVYCIPPQESMRFDDIEELEKNDLELVEQKRHPFQLLEDQPTLLLIAYLPKHVQRLYTHLFKHCAPLPLVHLVIEFLNQIPSMELCSLRLWILLTVLEPILIKYQLMNFLRATINRTVHTIKLEGRIYLNET